MSYYTDILITLNYEDYENAQSFYEKLMYIPGIGIDTEKYQTSEDTKEEKERIDFPYDRHYTLFYR